VTLQEAVPTTPPTSAQLLLGVKPPVLLVAKVTEPVGVDTGDVLSVTVAEQVVGWLSITEAGAQLTVVVVACTVIPTGRL